MYEFISKRECKKEKVHQVFPDLTSYQGRLGSIIAENINSNPKKTISFLNAMDQLLGPDEHNPLFLTSAK